MRNFYLIIFLFSVFACKQPQARKPISVTSGVSLKTSAERTKKRLATETKIIKYYISQDSTHQYKNTNNGFWFTYLKKDTLNSITPKYGDKITYTYSVQNLKNDTLYTAQEIGIKTHYIKQKNILEGLRKGLLLIKENETVKFIFPSQLAFGYRGDLKKINPNTPVIFNITTNKIETKTD